MLENKELVGKEVILKDSGVFTIVSCSTADPLLMNVTLSNDKKYRLSASFKLGKIRFVQEEMNQWYETICREEQENKREEEKKKVEESNSHPGNIIDTFREEYFFLSNMYPCSVTYQHMTYPCSEAAFQSQKIDSNKYSLDEELELQRKFTTITGYQSKTLGRKVKLRPDWNDIRLSIMKEILLCKFTQNSELKEKLLQTGNCILVEGNHWGDRYWGMVNGKGENHLGKLLMEVRQELKEKP